MNKASLLLFLLAACLPAAADIQLSHQIQAEPVFNRPVRISSSIDITKTFPFPFEAGLRFSAYPEEENNFLNSPIPWEFSSAVFRVLHSVHDSFSKDLSATFELFFNADSSVSVGASLDGALKHPPFSHLFSAGISFTPPCSSEFHITGSLLQVLNAEFGISYFAALSGEVRRLAASGMPPELLTSFTAGVRNSFVSSPDTHHLSVECRFTPGGIFPCISYLLTLEFDAM